MAITDVIASFRPAGLLDLSFAVFVGQEGIIVDTPERVEERLTTPGVDYARWRDVYLQYPANAFRTWAECISTLDYQNRCRRYRDAKTKFGTLTRVFRGVSTVWKNVKLEDVRIMPPIPSGIFGFGSANGLLTIDAIMTFRLTQPAE